MMLHNPILNGQYICIGQMEFKCDQTIEFDDETAKKMLSEYPFLVNIQEEKYLPSYCVQQRMGINLRVIVRMFSRSLKRCYRKIKNVLE